MSAPSGQAPEPPVGARPRRRGRRLALGLLAVLAALLACEGLMRLLLFGPAPFDALGADLRRPGRFADPDTEELYWTLTCTWKPVPAYARRPADHDARLGWRDPRFASGTYAHRDEARVGARRPVLLYGDSFAACHGQLERCWDVQLEEDELARELALLDYGVSGYGFDQITLLVEESLPRWLEHRPLVLIGVLVDDDLNRTGQRLRQAPKPWFTLEPGADGAELVYHPPAAGTVNAFLDANPPRSASWLVRGLLTSRLVPDAWRHDLLGLDEQQAHTAEVARALIVRLHAFLAAHEVEHAFVLFHGRASVRVDSYGWEEPLLLEELTRLRIPWVSTRTAFRADMAATGRTLLDYFALEGRARPHYGPTGMQVAFRAIRRALLGEFEGPDG